MKKQLLKNPFSLIYLYRLILYSGVHIQYLSRRSAHTGCKPSACRTRSRSAGSPTRRRSNGQSQRSASVASTQPARRPRGTTTQSSTSRVLPARSNNNHWHGCCRSDTCPVPDSAQPSARPRTPLHYGAARHAEAGQVVTDTAGSAGGRAACPHQVGPFGGGAVLAVRAVPVQAQNGGIVAESMPRGLEHAVCQGSRCLAGMQ